MSLFSFLFSHCRQGNRVLQTHNLQIPPALSVHVFIYLFCNLFVLYMYHLPVCLHSYFGYISIINLSSLHFSEGGPLSSKEWLLKTQWKRRKPICSNFYMQCNMQPPTGPVMALSSLESKDE